PFTAVEPSAGACTPLGLGLLASEAAFRAGLLHVTESATLGSDDEPIRASALGLIPADRTRAERMAFLADHALADLLTGIELADCRRLGLFLALPDGAPEPGALAEALRPVLIDRLGQPPPRAAAFKRGRSGFFFALEQALAALASDEYDAAIVGAVDSLCAPEAMSALDRERRLPAGAPLGGIIPGEAAAFILCEPAPATRRALAIVRVVATACEVFSRQQEEPNRGEALTDVLRALRGHPFGQGTRADLLYTCENGERFWAEELSLASLRNGSLIPEPFVRTMAAESFGDLGAAAGGVMLAMGLPALAAHAQADPATLLLVGSSDEGYVGACLVQGSSQSPEAPP
ncbi:MAG: hypothetical protein AB7O95_24365, partial [Geminicoccaceae bacterium]